MNRKLRLFLPTLIFFISASAQEKSFFDFSSMGLQYYFGTSIGITYNRIRDARPFICEVYYQQQSNPSPTWNNTKRLPQWGIGFSAAHAGSKYVGTVAAIYPYMKLPLFTAGILGSNLRFGFGVGWAQKYYDKVTNPENLLLSQRINTHANISWQNELRLSSHHFMSTTVSFYHWSNAKTNLPNLGMNIPAISVGYRYAFNGETRKPGYLHDTLNKRIFYKVFLTGGIKQMQVPDSSHYVVTILTGEVSKPISFSSTVSVGLFITHDASVKTDPLVKHLESINTSQVALYGSYEYNFGKVVVPVQFGIFLYNANSKMLESVGVRYKIAHNWMAEVLLKSHGHKADLMHLGVGYVFR